MPDSAGAEARGRPNPVWPLLVALVAALVYANSLSNGFALDDVRLVRDNTQIENLERLPDLLIAPYWGPGFELSGLYRPVTTISLSLNRFLAGPAPIGFHAVNLLLHALVSAGVWFVVRRVTWRYGAPLLAALLFALHPLHSEAVANVAGRAELLAALFVLAAWALHRRAMVAPSVSAATRRSIGAAACFLLALLSKESAILAPLLFALEDRLIARDGAKRRRVAPAYLLYGAALAGGVVLRLLALGGLRGARDVAFIDNPAAFAGPAVRVATALWIQLRYAGLFLWPGRLSSDYSYDAIPVVDSVADPRLWAGLLWAAALLAGLVYGWKRSRVLFTGLAIWVLFLLPSSSLLFAAGTCMAERLVYLASLGGCLIVGEVVAALAASFRRRANRRRNRGSALVVGLSIALLFCLAARTVARNSVWRDNLTLARHDAGVTPRSAKLHAGLGIALHDRGEPDAAAVSYRRALEIYPAYAQIHYNLGELLYDQGSTAEAMEHLARAAELSPTNPRPWKRLAPLLEQAGLQERALAAYAAGARLDPADFGLRFNLGRLLLTRGRVEEAQRTFAALGRDDPGGVPGNLARGLLAESRHDPAAAAAIYRELLRRPGLRSELRVRVESRLAAVSGPVDSR